VEILGEMIRKEKKEEMKMIAFIDYIIKKLKSIKMKYLFYC
jgi:hypothetical protein